MSGFACELRFLQGKYKVANAQLWDCSDILKITIFQVITMQKHLPLLSKLDKQVMSTHTALRAVF